MPEFLPSWNDTPTRKTIFDFVAAVTDESSPDYVTPAARIAVFDNDGTLWCEKPMYIQLDYLLRKLAAQAAGDASLRSKQPWEAAWEKDFDWLGGAVTKHYQGDDVDLQVLLGGILSLSDGMPVEQVEAEAKAFIENEHHPTLGRENVLLATETVGESGQEAIYEAEKWIDAVAKQKKIDDNNILEITTMAEGH
jgi:hypothetical protein